MIYQVFYNKSSIAIEAIVSELRGHRWTDTLRSQAYDTVFIRELKMN